VGNAVLDACGADLRENPLTPESVWREIQKLAG
jgi:CO/xanthine dehydrogenase Mo-binding subunit